MQPDGLTVDAATSLRLPTGSYRTDDPLRPTASLCLHGVSDWGTIAQLVAGCMQNAAIPMALIPLIAHNSSRHIAVSVAHVLSPDRLPILHSTIFCSPSANSQMQSSTWAVIVLVITVSSLLASPQLAQAQSCTTDTNTCLASGRFEIIGNTYYCCPGCTGITINYPSCTCSGCSGGGTSYSWVKTSTGSCSANCGGGTQTVTWRCEDQSGNTASASNCGNQPSSTQQCNTQACNTTTYSWVPTGTTACTASCGGGTQSTTYQCENQNGSMVASSNCGPEPSATPGSCNTQACTSSSPPWTGKFAPQGQCDQRSCCCLVGTFTISQSGSAYALEGPVSGACGSTTSMHSTGPYPSGYSFSTQFGRDEVDISLNADGTTITLVDNSSPQCGGTATRVTCNDATSPHYTYKWRENGVSACTALCGGGTRTIIHGCYRTNSSTEVEASCCAGPNPSTTAACNTQTCVPGLGVPPATGSYVTCGCCLGGSCSVIPTVGYASVSSCAEIEAADKDPAAVCMATFQQCVDTEAAEGGYVTQYCSARTNAAPSTLPQGFATTLALTASLVALFHIAM